MYKQIIFIASCVALVSCETMLDTGEEKIHATYETEKAITQFKQNCLDEGGQEAACLCEANANVGVLSDAQVIALQKSVDDPKDINDLAAAFMDSPSELSVWAKKVAACHS